MMRLASFSHGRRGSWFGHCPSLSVQKNAYQRARSHRNGGTFFDRNPRQQNKRRREQLSKLSVRGENLLEQVSKTYLSFSKRSMTLHAYCFVLNCLIYLLACSISLYSHSKSRVRPFIGSGFFLPSIPQALRPSGLLPPRSHQNVQDEKSDMPEKTIQLGDLVLSCAKTRLQLFLAVSIVVSFTEDQLHFTNPSADRLADSIASGQIWLNRGPGLHLAFDVHIEGHAIDLKATESWAHTLKSADLFRQLGLDTRILSELHTDLSSSHFLAAQQSAFQLRLSCDRQHAEPESSSLHRLLQDVPTIDVKPPSEVSTMTLHAVQFTVGILNLDAVVPLKHLSVEPGPRVTSLQSSPFSSANRSSNISQVDLSPSNEQSQDFIVGQDDRSHSFMDGLLDAAFRMTITDRPRKLAKGINTKSKNLDHTLSSIAPSLFCPNFTRELSRRSCFIPTIAGALTRNLVNNAKSESLQRKLLLLGTKEPSTTNPSEDDVQVSSHDNVSAKLWCFLHNSLSNTKAARKLKPLRRFSADELPTLDAEDGILFDNDVEGGDLIEIEPHAEDELFCLSDEDDELQYESEELSHEYENLHFEDTDFPDFHYTPKTHPSSDDLFASEHQLGVPSTAQPPPLIIDPISSPHSDVDLFDAQSPSQPHPSSPPFPVMQVSHALPTFSDFVLPPKHPRNAAQLDSEPMLFDDAVLAPSRQSGRFNTTVAYTGPADAWQNENDDALRTDALDADTRMSEMEAQYDHDAEVFHDECYGTQDRSRDADEIFSLGDDDAEMIYDESYGTQEKSWDKHGHDDVDLLRDPIHETQESAHAFDEMLHLHDQSCTQAHIRSTDLNIFDLEFNII